MKRILVSACLIGCLTRYDTAQKINPKLMKMAEDPDVVLIPVCPEQLGGLPTPRKPSERQQGNDRVLNDQSADMTREYRRGAEETLKIARLCRVDYAILKGGSPSCGCGQIYDGTFSGKKIPGDGVTTEYLKANGIRVICDEDL